MKLILTHNNSDFDSVAAQLCAARLFSGAYALLSDQLNANVREYLALYGDELTILCHEPPDTPPTELILVDTASSPQLKILGDRPLPTLIVDHHPLQRELQPHEQLIYEPVGATTTILARKLMGAQLTLNAAEATLLLLGIYEDTGSLAFRHTTREDLLCAAWLVGQGGRIDAVGEWLNRGLLPEQEAIYHQLERSQRTVEGGGWSILLAQARIDGTVPELAVLAHKLRDLYDPAALLLAFQTGENGTQLILRSNEEALDVGALARDYGGGGHPAAAAAFVRGRSAGELLDEIAERLPQLLRPAVTAAAVMTHQITSIEPQASVREAEALLTRHGHSALPVLDEQGRVQGLIARRDIDRALRHGLSSAPVSRYMWREPPLVGPDTPLTTLRRALADEDIARVGRLLVVDDEHKLLGLITRSDLLRAWRQSAPATAAAHEQLTNLLEQRLPPTVLDILRRAAAIADAQGSGLYIVGGVVRDLILGRSNGDFDLVVEGDAVAVARALARDLSGQVYSHDQFGTATVKLALEHPANTPTLLLDFVTARTEFYEQPSALPQVEPASLRHDLHRRDFTINTLAVCLNTARYGWLYDFYGGRRDIRKRLVRVLHNLSFIDDPTRLLRAVRLASRLEFKIEPRTRALIDDAVEQDVLSRTTPARITHELRLLLREDQPEQAVTLLDQLGLLRALHPDLRWTPDLAKRFGTARAAAWPKVDLTDLYLSVLVYNIGDVARAQIIARYRLAGVQARLLRELGAIQQLRPLLADPATPASVIDRELHKFMESTLCSAQLMEAGQAAVAIARYCDQLRRVNTSLGGRDLIALGIKPGPRIGKLLAGLRAARLDGEVQTEEEERAWLQDRL